MKEEQLIEQQDGYIEYAKHTLMENGRLYHLGIAITKGDNVENVLDDGKFGIQFPDPKKIFVEERSKYGCLIVDMNPDFKDLYYQIGYLHPKHHAVMENLRQIGVEAGLHTEEDSYKIMCNAFCMATGAIEKDISSQILRMICQKVGAFAAISLAEGWHAFGPRREDMPDSLEDYEGSTEVIICAMDTTMFRRMITVPILREPSEKKGEGKITGFGDIEVHWDRLDDEKTKMTGRFVNFLRPLNG